MSYVPLILSGYVYSHESETIIDNVIITVTNNTTKEIHNGSEVLFPELTTNSSGEWQVNLANFTSGYSNLDEIEISLEYNGLKDLVKVTISGNNNIDSIILTPLDNKVYDFERAIDYLGCKILIYTESRTLDTEYESIDTETIARHEIEDDTYGSIQINNDDMIQAKEGIINQGSAIGYFKVRYNVDNGYKIRIPTDTDNYWIVQDHPIRRYFNNLAAYDEAKLVKIQTSFVTAAAGSTADTTVEAQTPWYCYGASCTGSDGDYNRTLTITTSSMASLEKIYLDGLRLTVGVDYDAVYNSTNMVITFDGVQVWDSQKIGVDYSL